MVLLSAGPGNQHTFGLDCLELLLLNRGLPVLNLATDLGLPTLRLLCTSLRPGAVVVVSHNPTTATRSAHTTQTLHDDGWQVYYAGAAFTSQPVRARSGGTPLDDTLTRTAEHLTRRHRRQAAEDPCEHRTVQTLCSRRHESLTTHVRRDARLLRTTFRVAASRPFYARPRRRKPTVQRHNYWPD